MPSNRQSFINFTMAAIFAMCPCASNISYANVDIRELASIPDRQRSINLDEVTKVHPLDKSIFTKENVVKYIPTNLTPTTDEKLVFSQMQVGLGQRLSDSFFNGDFFKKSTVGHITQEIQEVTNQSISFQATPTGVEQKINFHVKAVEKIAAVAYQGYFSSSITYRMDSNNIVTDISKPLSSDTTLSLNNTSPMGRIEPAANLMLTHSF